MSATSTHFEREAMKKLLVLLFCVALPMFGAPAVMVTPVTSQVPVAATVEQVRRAITTAATELKWIPRADGQGKIEAKLNVRQHELVVVITFTKDSYTITYKDSKKLNYNAKRNTIHTQYATWVKNLDNRIQRVLVQ